MASEDSFFFLKIHLAAKLWIPWIDLKYFRSLLTCGMVRFPNSKFFRSSRLLLCNSSLGESKSILSSASFDGAMDMLNFDQKDLEL